MPGGDCVTARSEPNTDHQAKRLAPSPAGIGPQCSPGEGDTGIGLAVLLRDDQSGRGHLREAQGGVTNTLTIQG